jgi:O-antigen/teichoic acid export membrane protein
VFSPSRFFGQMMGVGPIKRHSIISLVSNIGVTAIGYLATFYIAHTIGAAPLGAFFLFFAYWNIFNLIADGGVGGAAIQRISEGHDQNEYFTAHIALRALFLIVTLLIVIFIGYVIADTQVSGLISWLLIALIVGTIGATVTTGVYGSGKVGISQIADLINTIVKVVIQIGAVYLGFSVDGLIGGFIAGMIAGALVNIRFLALHLARFHKTHIRSLLSYALWAFLAGATGVVVGYADTILVGYYLNTTEVGLYRVAVQFSAIAAFIAVSMRLTLYPKISRWKQEGDILSVETSISRAFTYSFFLAIPVLVGAGLLAEPILYFLYGAAFSSATMALILLLAAQIVMVFVTLETMTLNALNHPREAFRSAAAAAVTLVILDIILIPLIGISGAALALLISMGVNALLAHWFARHHVSINLEKMPVIHIVLASIIMGIVLELFRVFIPFSQFLILLAAVLLGAAIYLLLILKWDTGIHDELKEFTLSLGLPWPSWL